jgi:hypothetical protein
VRTSPPRAESQPQGRELVLTDRREARRCTATAKATGQRCKRLASPGASVCVKHGAGAPQVKAAAARRLAEGKARAVLADLEKAAPVVDPFAALEDLAGQTVALVSLLRGMVSDLEAVRYRGGPGSGTEQLRGELQAYLAALTRAESVLGRIVSLDLQGRRLRLAEAQVAAVVGALDTVLSHRDLGLDVGRQRRGRELLARQLGAPSLVLEVRSS